MAGLSQDEAPLATPHPEPSSEQRAVIGLTINLTVNGVQFVPVRSGLSTV
jgi:hypothetical protein